jgi:hypothetical protein
LWLWLLRASAAFCSPEVAYYDPYVPVIKSTREHSQFAGKKIRSVALRYNRKLRCCSYRHQPFAGELPRTRRAGAMHRGYPECDGWQPSRTQKSLESVMKEPRITRIVRQGWKTWTSSEFLNGSLARTIISRKTSLSRQEILLIWARTARIHSRLIHNKIEGPSRPDSRVYQRAELADKAGKIWMKFTPIDTRF